jgi:class 3 adenylate cyclase/tetratricopeptide (TPR) repeat protein
LFCDVKGSTQLAAAIEPELYEELIETLRAEQKAIVLKHGGQIAFIEGDGMACIFGYPESHEDAGRRATEAAIDLHEAAACLDPGFGDVKAQIRLHSGIHSGTALVRRGDVTCGRFEMLGDPTNVARKLCSLGGSDEIVVSEATLGSDRHFFRSAQRPDFLVEGHDPIAILTIQGRETVATRLAARTRDGATPFAGRTGELARMRAWLAAGPSGLMAVTGPAGIGKSRFVAELLNEAAMAGIAVHRSYCEAYLGARPLQPFTQLVRSITGDSSVDLSNTSTISGEPVPGAGLERAIEIMRMLIERIASEGRAILLIDDWQWADGASREVLDELIPDTGEIGFLIASRETELGLRSPENSGTIELPRLSLAEAQDAIASLLTAPDLFLARRIVEESGGNPLYLEELCHARSRHRADRQGTEPNARLDMLVQARFAELGPRHADLVRTAAVIGYMVPAWLFTAVTGVVADDPVLAELREADFLFPSDVDGILRFKHGLTRDAVYRVIGLKERQALHRRVVEALRVEGMERGEQPLLDAFAHHYAASGDGGRAVPYAIRAGDAALAAGALDRAQAHYRAAFEIVAARGDGGAAAKDIWRLVNKYGLACIVDPAPDQLPVIREMAQRLQALGDAPGRVRSEYWLGAIAYGLGEGKLSVRHLTTALHAATQLGERHFLPQLTAKLAQSLFAAGNYDEADALFTQVLATIARKDARMDDESHVYALCCHGFLHADRGDFAAAERRYAEADAVRGSSSPPLLASYLTQKSAVCLFRGEWEEALTHARNCLETCGRIRARYQAMMSNALGAYAQWQLDRDKKAIDTLTGAVGWFAAGGSRQRTSLVHGWLADIMAETGRMEEARHHAACAVARARRAGDRLGEAMAHRAVAGLAARHGEADRAERHLAAARRSASVRGSRREEAQNRLCEAQIALEANDRARAETALAEAQAAFAAMGMHQFARRANAMSLTSR